jgi:hypothetical protein
MDVIFWELICTGDREEAIQVMQIYELNQSRPSSNNRQLSVHTVEVDKSIIKALPYDEKNYISPSRETQTPYTFLRFRSF